MSTTEEVMGKLLSYKVKSFVDREQLARDVAVSSTNLSDAFCSQADMFAYYSAQAAHAEHQFERLKDKKDWLMASIDHALRQEAIAKGDKLTEPQIEKMILRDPRYQKFASLCNDAKREVARAKGATEAFKQRRDMLVQAGADERQERKGSLRMSQVDSVEALRAKLNGKSA